MIQPQVKISLTARNQGNRGSCVAFSLAGIKGIVDNRLLSPEYAYLATVHQSPTWQPNQGLDVRIAIAATETGLPEEQHYPYKYDEPCRPLPALPNGFPLYGPHLSLLQPDLSKVRSRLASGEPVGILIAITQSFMNPIDGLIHFEAGTFPGLHAIVIVGFGQNAAGEDHYLICNSWGSSWGDDGHAWLSETYLAHHATCIYGATP